MWWTLYYVTFQSTWFVSNFTAAGLSNIGCYNVDYWSSLLNSRDRNRNYCMDWLKYKTNTHKHTHKHTHNHIHTHIYIYIYMYVFYTCMYLSIMCKEMKLLSDSSFMLTWCNWSLKYANTRLLQCDFVIFIRHNH